MFTESYRCDASVLSLILN